MNEARNVKATKVVILRDFKFVVSQIIKEYV